MSPQNLTTKEIQNYKIRSIVFLILMIIGLLSAFYFYLQVQEHQKELKENNKTLERQKDSLEVRNATILKQANTIVNLQEHQKQKEQLKDAIDLVQILVNKDADNMMSTDEILGGLHKMAETEKEKQAAYTANRAKFIENLFDRNENKRIDARRKLSRLHADDPKLVKEILATVSSKILTNENPINLIDQYQNNISQMLYLFSTLSTQSLNSEKIQLEAFFTVLSQSNIFSPAGKTIQQIEEIRNKLKAV